MTVDMEAEGDEDVEMIADPAEEDNVSTGREDLDDDEDEDPNGQPDVEEAESSKDEEEEEEEGEEEGEEEEDDDDDDEDDDDDDEDDDEEEDVAGQNEEENKGGESQVNGENDKAEVGTEYHGAVKVPDGATAESEDEEEEDEEEEEEEEEEEDSSGDNESGSEGSSDESSSESGAENEWEGEQSVEGEVGQADIKARNDCIQDEEHDPSEEFEEYLACAVCGDNAHRQCARDKESFKDDVHDASSWRCPSCTENGLEVGTAAASEDDQDSLSLQRRLSISSARITRDLLPATKGSSKPGSHSIFNTLILDDDPGDGARALRKRKSSEATEELRSRASSKRPKTSDSRQEQVGSPIASGRGARSTTAASRTRRASAAATEKKDEALGMSSLATARPQRQRRSRKDKAGNSRVIRQTKSSIILALKVDLSRITFRPPKRKRGPGRRRASQAAAASTSLHSIAPYTTPYYAFHDRDNDDSKKPPYGGILSEEEADTSATMPTAEDRAKFESARQRAEEDWKRRSVAAEAAQEVKGRASQKVSGPPSKIKSIIFGKWEIETWYAAPYPEEYSRNRVLYICEFCLKYMGSDFVAWRHKLKCPCKYPPGDEIYRDGSISVFEVDGRKNPAYCQNLCLLAKLFLGSKTLYYDVEPFLFYIMTEYDKNGYHFVGYFSKEKRPSSMNNVSCILTMPHHQRKGYGHLLIDFSYLLTRKENRTGSPEKPLSDMGLVSYRNYWRLQLCYLLIDAKPGEDSMSIKSISDQLGMTPDDVISQLEALRVLVRDPVTKAYAFRLDKAYFKETIEKWEAKGHQRLNADRLVWTPYIMSRTSNLAIFDRPPIATVAPRESEDDEDEDDDLVPEEGVQQELAAEKAAAAAAALANSTNGVATSDFAAGSACDDKDEPMQGVLEEALSSPAKAPTLALINGVIASHSPAAAPQSPIPPWRYELWPPVPGTIYRSRRGGYRPKGSRITPHGALYGARSNSNVPATTPRGSRTSLRVSNKAATATSTVHLSKEGDKGLDGTVSVGSGKDSAKASPTARRSTRSRVGTPGQDRAPANEGKAVGADEEDDEEDDDGDDDDGDSGSDDENIKLEGEAIDEEDDAASQDSSDSGSADNEDLDVDIDADVDGDAEADEDYEDAEEDPDGEEDGDEDDDVPMDD